MTAVRREIGDLLVDNGVITQEDLDLVRAEHAKTGHSVVDILSKKGLANENQLKNALELEYGVNFVDLLKPKTRPDDDAVRLLPEDFMRSHQVVGVNLRTDRLTLAMVDPSDSAAVSAVKEKFPDVQVKTVVCVEDALLHFFDEFFGKANGAGESGTNGDSNGSGEVAAKTETEPKGTEAVNAEAVNAETAADVSESGKVDASVGADSSTTSTTTAAMEDAVAAAGAESIDAAVSNTQSIEDAAEEEAHLQGAGAGSKSKTPTHTRLEAQTVPEANEQVEKAEEEAVVLLANQILGGAIKRGATHIHIIPGDREAVVNYRIAGLLVVDRKLPKTIVTSVINRYKIMAKLNVNEKSCLDGHIKVKSSSKEIVCLVSIIPTQHGEHAVVWIV